MVRPLLGRALSSLLTVIAALALLQGLLMLAPGDPIDLLPNGAELRPQLEAEWRLDRPPLERIVGAEWDALRGDLGTSLSVRPGARVADLVLRAGLGSLGVLLPALGLSMLLGGALAALPALRQARAPTRALAALPVFLLAWLLVTGLDAAAWAGMERGWIERPDWFALPDQPSALRWLLAVFALAVGSGALSEVQGTVAEELRRFEDEGTADGARALGLPAWPHIALNLLPPLATALASRAAFFVGGLVVIEKVLLLGGAGALLWDAALGRDYPLALGLGLGAALVVAGARLLADLLRLGLDPRLREDRA